MCIASCLALAARLRVQVFGVATRVNHTKRGLLVALGTFWGEPQGLCGVGDQRGP